MILTEKDKAFIISVLGSEVNKEQFVDLWNRKIEELKDCSTFKQPDHEKDLSADEIYASRMSAMTVLRDFAHELLIVLPKTRIEPKETKGKI